MTNREIVPEQRSMEVYSVEMVHPGKTGPGLLPHDAKRPCNIVLGSGSEATGYCAPSGFGEGGIHLAAQDNTVDQMDAVLGNGVFYRHPLVNNTGLKGHFDMSIHYLTERPNPNDGDGVQPSFEQALEQQLGLRMILKKATVPVLVIDHAEAPSEN